VPYSPIGVNAYQLGMLILQILLYNPDKEYKISVDIRKEIEQVKATDLYSK
jgi:hypothetical protein